jgi:hypothetical protein
MENSMEASQNTYNRTAYDPAIPLLGIYLKYVNEVTIKAPLNKSLFTIDKLWK